MSLEDFRNDLPQRFHILRNIMGGLSSQTSIERMSSGTSAKTGPPQNSLMRLATSRHLIGAIHTIRIVKNQILKRKPGNDEDGTSQNKIAPFDRVSDFGQVRSQEPSRTSDDSQLEELDENSFSISYFSYESDWPGSCASDFFFPLGIEEILQVRPILRYLKAQIESVKISGMAFSWILIIREFRNSESFATPTDFLHEAVARKSAFLKLVAQKMWNAVQHFCRNRHLTKRAFVKTKKFVEKRFRHESTQLKFDDDDFPINQGQDLASDPYAKPLSYLEGFDQNINFSIMDIGYATSKVPSEMLSNHYDSLTNFLREPTNGGHDFKSNGTKDFGELEGTNNMEPQAPLLSCIPFDYDEIRKLDSLHSKSKVVSETLAVSEVLMQSHFVTEMMFAPETEQQNLHIGTVKSAKVPDLACSDNEFTSEDWSDAKIFISHYNITPPDCAQEEFESPDTNDNTLTEEPVTIKAESNSNTPQMDISNHQHEGHSTISYLQKEAWSEEGPASHRDDCEPSINSSFDAKLPVPAMVAEPNINSRSSSKGSDSSWVKSPILSVKITSTNTSNYSENLKVGTDQGLETNFLPSGLDPNPSLPEFSRHKADITPALSVVEAFATFAPMKRKVEENPDGSTIDDFVETTDGDLTDSPSNDESSLDLLTELESGILPESSEDVEDLAEKCRRKLFCFTPMWTKTNLLLLEFEDDGSFAMRSPSITIRFAEDADVWNEESSCNEKRSVSRGTDGGQQSISWKNSKLTGSPLQDPKIDWERIGVNIKNEEAEALRGILKNYRRVFVHLTNNVVMPCNENIKMLIKEILAVRRMTGDIFSQASGISGETSMINEILEDTDDIDRSYWHNRIENCSFALTNLDKEMQQVQKTLTTLKFGFDARLTKITGTISKIKIIRDRILTKYFVFCESNESQGSFGSQNVHQCTLVHEYKQRTLWHYLVDIDDFQSFLSKNIGALESSCVSVRELIVSINVILSDASQTMFFNDQTLQ